MVRPLDISRQFPTAARPAASGPAPALISVAAGASSIRAPEPGGLRPLNLRPLARYFTPGLMACFFASLRLCASALKRGFQRQDAAVPGRQGAVTQEGAFVGRLPFQRQTPSPEKEIRASFPRRLLGAARLVGGLLLFFLAGSALGEQRFPPPDFVETNHKIPATATPAARAIPLHYVDIAVLAGALGVATWLVYARRSRKGLVWLSLFSIAYFGFYRNGCICAIGSIQNVSLALADRSYALPWGALAFFGLPLAVALFGGRTFCAGVCPHGALQDLFLLKPLKLPHWLDHGLSILPFVYLGVGILFAATGSIFLLCQYDPFIPIFRLSGRTVMVTAGIAFLLLSVFVGRPYCRFLCPYGALLKLASIVAKFRVRVTPDTCTQCKLCEHSCPFGAMREPEAAKPELSILAVDRRRLTWLLILAPALILGGAWLGGRFSGPAARLNPTVSLAEQFVREKDTPLRTGALSPSELALQRARENPRSLLTDAAAIRRQFVIGSWLLGGWVGLVLVAKWVSLSLYRRRTDYEPDRGSCFACARCFEFCPSELVRRGLMPAAPAADTTLPQPLPNARTHA